jgi:hypothetical protein
VPFYILNNDLLLGADTLDTCNRVNLYSFRNDTASFICKKPKILFGIGPSRIVIRYISKGQSYSSVVIESDESLFFHRIEYDNGISAMVLNEVCMLGHTRLRRVYQ